MPYLSQFLRDFDFSGLNLSPTKEETLSTDPLNANYTSNERKAGFNSKDENATLDTTDYDAKIAQLTKAINDIGYIGSTKVSKGKGFWGTNSIEAERNAQKKAQRDALQAQLNSVNANKESYLKSQANRTNLDSATTQADQALQAQQQSQQATANANKIANINSGINKSRAGMLGSQAASGDTSVAQNQYQANRSTAASTQADYKEKMAQADALQQTAGNMSQAAGLAALSGGLQGAGSGAAMGAVISDENCKQADGIDESELKKSVKQFFELYDRVKKLKEKQ